MGTGTVPLFEKTLVANNTALVCTAFGWSGIDRLEFSSAPLGVNPWDYHFAMDNFTYEAVPIPSAVWLLGSGLLGLLGLKRKFLG
ncbi:MAG: hypothetical protein A4E43_00627 [Methanosaeta sp. PtaB.Bin005]|nr:MAG: hypothetical protein A4E43_00627 [Methanosaeta sp. PtaB.Bin005]